MARTIQSSSLSAVAAGAKVSAMTVSRVLRNSPHVSKATRETPPPRKSSFLAIKKLAP